jgi:hypothetical protein
MGLLRISQRPRFDVPSTREASALGLLRRTTSIAGSGDFEPSIEAFLGHVRDIPIKRSPLAGS